MAKLSSSNGKKANVPKLRFPGFEEEWKQVKLGDVVTVGNGMDYKKLEKGNIPVYGTGGYMLSVNKALSYDKDAIGIGRKGTIDKPYILRAPFWTVDTLFYCIPNNDFSFGFVYGIFQKVNWKRKDESTGVPSLSKTNINSTTIAVPTIQEQNKIADLLTLIDERIAKQAQIADRLKKYKRGALSVLFPKKGEITPQYRFAGFTESWEQRKLGDYCDMYNGDRSSKYPNAQDMVIEGIPFINAGDLENGHVNLATCNKISREKYDDLGGAKLQLGDIVYCLRGTLGKNAYIDNFPEGTVASSLVAIRPKNIDGRFLFHVLNSDIEYRQRVVHDEGAAQPNLSAKSVSEFVMPVPHIDEQKKISEYLDNLNRLVTLHQHKCDILLSLKKALLHKMFI